MKKIMSLLGMILILSLVFTGIGFAEETEYDTLPDWQIKIPVPDGVEAVLEGSSFYLYLEESVGAIPYVMVRTNTEYEDESDFVNNYFTDYMKEQYSDLVIAAPFAPVSIEGRDFYEIDFEYSVQGFTVTDRRVFKTIDGRTYMFATKEIEELDMTVGDLLETVAAQCVFLRDGEAIDEEELGSGDDDILYINWEDFEPFLEEEDIQGEFISFEEVGYEMFMPSFMYPSELPEEQENPETFVGFYQTFLQDAYVSVQFIPMAYDLQEYRAFLEVLVSLGSAEGLDDFIINGNPFVLYYMPETDILCLSTYTGEGILEFTFYPSSNSDFISYAEIMASSIRKMQ